jgi:hypothetical protein
MLELNENFWQTCRMRIEIKKLPIREDAINQCKGNLFLLKEEKK